MSENSGRDLGTAVVAVEVDFSQLKQAAEQMQSIAQTIRSMQDLLRTGNENIRNSATEMLAAVKNVSSGIKQENAEIRDSVKGTVNTVKSSANQLVGALTAAQGKLKGKSFTFNGIEIGDQTKQFKQMQKDSKALADEEKRNQLELQRVIQQSEAQILEAKKKRAKEAADEEERFLKKIEADAKAGIAARRKSDKQLLDEIVRGLKAEEVARKAVDQKTFESQKTAAERAEAEWKQAFEGIRNEANKTQSYLSTVANAFRVGKNKVPEMPQAGTSGNRPSNAGSVFPTFIQFSAYPFASFANMAGAPGLSQLSFMAGDIMGMADAIIPFKSALDRLAVTLGKSGGLFGALATAGSAALAPLGAGAAKLGAVAAAAAPFVAGILAVGAVFSAVSNEIQRAREEGRKFAEVIGQIADAAAGGQTTDEAEDQLAEIERRIAGRQARISSIRTILQNRQALADTSDGSTRFVQMPGALNQRADIFREVSAVIGTTITSGIELNAYLTDLEKQISDLGNEAALQAASIEDSTFAYGDAEAELARQRGIANSRAQEAIQATAEAAQMSSEEGDQRVADLQNEANAINQYIGALTGEERESAEQRLDTIRKLIPIYDAADASALNFAEGIEKFIDILRDAADQAAAAAAASEQYVREEQRTNEDQTRSDIRDREDFELQRKRQNRDFEQDTIRQDRDFYRQMEKSARDFQRDMTKFEQDYLENVAEIEEDDFERSEKAEKEHQDRLAKILRDSRREIYDAAAELDAKGVYQAIQKRNDALADEQKGYADEAEERAKDKAERLKDLRENYEQEKKERLQAFAEAQKERAEEYQASRAQRMSDYAQRLRDEDYDRAIRQQREAEDRYIAWKRRNEDFVRSLNQYGTYWSNVMSITAAGANATELLIAGMWARIAMGAPGTPNLPPKAPIIPKGGLKGFLATGNYGGITTEGAYYLHRGERVFPSARASEGMGNSTTVTIENFSPVFGDIGDFSRPEVMEMMHQSVIDVMTAAKNAAPLRWWGGG